MGTFVIAYDLNRERAGWENDRTRLLAHIKATYDWARLSESSYAIYTTQTATAVIMACRKFLDANDTLYVITLSRPWEGSGPKEVIAWLKAKLGYP